MIDDEHIAPSAMVQLLGLEDDDIIDIAVEIYTDLNADAPPKVNPHR